MLWSTRETGPRQQRKVKLTKKLLSFLCCTPHPPLSSSPPFSCLLVVPHTKVIFIGELAHALRFLASVVSQSFLAFGDILELHRKFLELSGGINRIFELEELLDAAQSGISFLFP